MIPSIIAKLFWFLSFLSAIVGVYFGFIGFETSQGAPQQAAAAALGCLIAIGPYILARSVDGIARRGVAATDGARDHSTLWAAGVAAIIVIGSWAAMRYWPVIQLPSNAYRDFQDNELAWHQRCDAYLGPAVAEQDRAKAATCRQEGDRITADAKAKGWR